MGFSVGSQVRMLNYELGAGNTLYVALFTASGEVPLTGLGYQRKAVAFNILATDPAVARNAGSVNFGPAPGSWGRITKVAIFDAPVGGNLKLIEAVDPVDVPTGSGFPIAVGAIEVRI